MRKKSHSEESVTIPMHLLPIKRNCKILIPSKNLDGFGAPKKDCILLNLKWAFNDFFILWVSEMSIDMGRCIVTPPTNAKSLLQDLQTHIISDLTLEGDSKLDTAIKKPRQVSPLLIQMLSHGFKIYQLIFWTVIPPIQIQHSQPKAIALLS